MNMRCILLIIGLSTPLMIKSQDSTLSSPRASTPSSWVQSPAFGVVPGTPSTPTPFMPNPASNVSTPASCAVPATPTTEPFLMPEEAEALERQRARLREAQREAILDARSEAIDRLLQTTAALAIQTDNLFATNRTNNRARGAASRGNRGTRRGSRGRGAFMRSVLTLSAQNID